LWTRRERERETLFWARVCLHVFVSSFDDLLLQVTRGIISHSISCSMSLSPLLLFIRSVTQLSKNMDCLQLSTCRRRVTSTGISHHYRYPRISLNAVQSNYRTFMQEGRSSIRIYMWIFVRFDTVQKPMNLISSNSYFDTCFISIDCRHRNFHVIGHQTSVSFTIHPSGIRQTCYIFTYI
jgi:hypothetical protein